MPNGKNSAWIRKALITIVSILVGTLLAYSALFVSYNYAQDEKRSDKNIVYHEKTDKCIADIKIEQAKLAKDVQYTKEKVDIVDSKLDRVLDRLPRK